MDFVFYQNIQVVDYYVQYRKKLTYKIRQKLSIHLF